MTTNKTQFKTSNAKTIKPDFFDPTPLTFAEALSRHSAMEDAVNNLSQEHAKDVMDVYEELTGTGIPMSDASRAVRYEIPVEFAPLWRIMGNIPATFYCASFADGLRRRVEANDPIDYNEIAREALETLKQRREMAEIVHAGWGWDKSASWFMVMEIEKLPDYNKKQVIQIARLAGRMLKQVDGWQPPIPADAMGDKVTGITSGDEIDRMTADEIAAMGMDPDAMQRVADGFAQEYRMQGMKPSGSGPFVFVEDQSGSMHNTRMVYAKAVGSTLIRIAHAEGRDVRVVHFATGTLVQDVPKDNEEAFISYLTTFLNGGTSIGKALEVATREAVKKSTDSMRADIVIATDGQDGDNERITRALDTCDSANVKVWSIGICIDFSQAELAKRSQRYIAIHDMTSKAGTQVADLLKDAAIDWSKRGEA